MMNARGKLFKKHCHIRREGCPARWIHAFAMTAMLLAILAAATCAEEAADTADSAEQKYPRVHVGSGVGFSIMRVTRSTATADLDAADE